MQSQVKNSTINDSAIETSKETATSPITNTATTPLIEPIKQQQTESALLSPYQPSPHIITDDDVTNKIDSLYKIINNNDALHKSKSYINKNDKTASDKPPLIEPDTHLVNNMMNAILDKATGELLEYK